ncbi:hypothetical protein [Variovorax guangxiensis]|uniref:hypothetical protein n=1 Tax=Variovorax guangxiensis TaxID=1775474 RepID=UPI00286AD7B6|nr:hypothetical protein [Variovorax guangxiensis]
MADLLVRGNVILEEHRLLECAIGDAFEVFVFEVLDKHGTSKEAFAETLVALDRLRSTIDQLPTTPLFSSDWSWEGATRALLDDSREQTEAQIVNDKSQR